MSAWLWVGLAITWTTWAVCWCAACRARRIERAASGEASIARATATPAPGAQLVIARAIAVQAAEAAAATELETTADLPSLGRDLYADLEATDARTGRTSSILSKRLVCEEDAAAEPTRPSARLFETPAALTGAGL